MNQVKKGCQKLAKTRKAKTAVKRSYPPLQLRENTEVVMELTEAEEAEINEILHGDKITKEQFEALPGARRQQLAGLFTRALNVLALEDRDRFIEQVSDIITESKDTRRQLWELNHFLIMKAIDSLTRKYNRFPSRGEIQSETELSRNTINKHLKEYFTSDAYAERKDEYFAMRENILSRLYSFATQGDTKAAKIFLDATAFTAEAPKIQNQNNYLQVNALTITQEQISQLPAPERDTFFEIIKKFSTVATATNTQTKNGNDETVD